MRLVLVRHGETQWNAERRIVGHTEIGLNEAGLRQAELLAKALSNVDVSAIYSSPLMRARQTAEAVAKPHDLPVGYIDVLKEFDAGELDGLTIDEVMELNGNFFDRWMDGETELRMPGGESIADLKKRAWPALQQIIADHTEDTVIVVSHTMVIITVIVTALGMELANFRRLRPALASVSVIDFGRNGTSLVRFNDTCHL